MPWPNFQVHGVNGGIRINHHLSVVVQHAPTLWQLAWMVGQILGVEPPLLSAILLFRHRLVRVGIRRTHSRRMTDLLGYL